MNKLIKTKHLLLNLSLIATITAAQGNGESPILDVTNEYQHLLQQPALFRADQLETLIHGDVLDDLWKLPTSTEISPSVRIIKIKQCVLVSNSIYQYPGLAYPYNLFYLRQHSVYAIKYNELSPAGDPKVTTNNSFTIVRTIKLDDA